jgi:uncharacterized protein YaaR (DUF327 family)
MEDINNIILIMKTEKLETIAIIIADAWKFKFYKLLMSLINETVDQGDIMKKIMQEKDLKSYGKFINQTITKVIKNMGKYSKFSLSPDEELQFFQDIKPLLENKYQCNINILWENDSIEEKASQALPGKPAIIIS